MTLRHGFHTRLALTGVLVLSVSACGGHNEASQSRSGRFASDQKDDRTSARQAALARGLPTERLWKLAQLGDEQAPPTYPQATYVRFWLDGPVVGFIGCQGFGGGASWSQDGGLHGMNTPMIGPAMECGDGDQPSAPIVSQFWSKMQNASRWQLTNNALLIYFKDGTSAKLIEDDCSDRAGIESESAGCIK